MEKLNRRIRSYSWPNGARPPTFTTGYLEKGTASGEPKTGCHVHMTAGDVLRFATHSIDLMLPLIGDISDPVWECWVIHVKYLRLLLLHQITHSDVVELDRLIYEHHTKFLEVYGERMFKPKNHFASHFPSDILNHGPVRHYWCMRFEALNQMFKNLAKGGSFRNTVGRVAEMWSLRVAMERKFGTKLEWGATQALESSEAVTFKQGTANALSGVYNSVLQRLLKHKKEVVLEWVHALKYKGYEVDAGKSWLSATYKGEAVLAFVPNGGIFKHEGKYYFYLQFYPATSVDTFGMPSASIDKQYIPNCKLVWVDSPNLKDVIMLWMSHRVERSQTIDLRFVSLE